MFVELLVDPLFGGKGFQLSITPKCSALVEYRSELAHAAFAAAVQVNSTAIFKYELIYIRESTKQINRRVAEQMEAARKTQLAKGEVGIRDLKPAPTLAEFVKRDFRPFIERTHAEKRNTLLHYQYATSILLSYGPVAHAHLDKVSADLIGSLVESIQGRGLSVVTVNRTLGCLRRMLKLAVEWKTIRAPDSPIRLLPGEKRRERVLTAEEDAAYFAAARQIGAGIVQEY